MYTYPDGTILVPFQAKIQLIERDLDSPQSRRHRHDLAREDLPLLAVVDVAFPLVTSRRRRRRRLTGEEVAVGVPARVDAHSVLDPERQAPTQTRQQIERQR